MLITLRMLFFSTMYAITVAYAIYISICWTLCLNSILLLNDLMKQHYIVYTQNVMSQCQWYNVYMNKYRNTYIMSTYLRYSPFIESVIWNTAGMHRLLLCIAWPSHESFLFSSFTYDAIYRIEFYRKPWTEMLFNGTR